MRLGPRELAQDDIQFNAQTDLKEIVMGLHWDPPQAGAGAEVEDLDALCVLFDLQRRPLEVIHPGHPRNDNGSVIHTGDSKTGASAWDDERIFVFLDALPEAVGAVSFLVVSATGRAFGEVRGASCHVSDHATERECLRVDLTTLEAQTAHCVAMFCRSATGWVMSADAPLPSNGLLADFLSRTDYVKTGESRNGRRE